LLSRVTGDLSLSLRLHFKLASSSSRPGCNKAICEAR
jgi:hypothetical protein